MIHFVLILTVILVGQSIFCKKAKASEFHLSVGTDLFQAQYKEQRYKFDNFNAFKQPNKNITRVSIGITYKPFDDYHFYLTARTNRLINAPVQTTAFDLIAKQNVNVFQKLIADSLIVSVPIHKNVMPFLVATRATAETTFMYSTQYVKSNITTTLYGGGLSFSFLKKHSIAFTYFLGNKDFNTKRAFGISYNYLIF